MNEKVLFSKIKEYERNLRREEKSTNTILKYSRDLRAFLKFANNREADKEVLLDWKERLMKKYAPASVNSMLASVNSFFDWLERPQYKVKPLKIQRMIFARPEKELTRTEYNRLVKTAKKMRNERLSLLLQTMCSTGIRVSELRYITLESTGTGRATVDCKGKTRTVFLTKDLCNCLRRYCRDRKIRSGPVFRTAGGKPLDRSNIWRDMKSLCKSAGVEQSKVFPHNLRHLFAKIFYTMEKDLSKLADLLGHSSIATTRIYTMESGKEHMRQLERMQLVLENKKDHITMVM